MFTRQMSTTDRIFAELERALGTVLGTVSEPSRPSPALDETDGPLDDAGRRHVAGLMRINHVGEVCAQALYSGQAALARDERIREQLLEAAAEETDHLAWCAERLAALDSRPSVLNPLWYAGSFALGVVAALVGDRVSLGFVVETEKQVEAHLGEHLEKLPPEAVASRAVVAQMKDDEARHGALARAAGGIDLPPPIPRLMRFASLLMKTVAYRL